MPQPSATSKQRTALPAVRRAVRALLEQSPGFRQATPALRKHVANQLVNVSMLGAALLAEEEVATETMALEKTATQKMATQKTATKKTATQDTRASQVPGPAAMQASQVLGPAAAAMDAGEHTTFSAARNAAGTLKAIRESLDFPSYVASLITGVFQAITRSSVSQITGLSDLLDNVAASSDEFATSNIGDRDATSWAVGRFSFLAPNPDGGLMVRPDQDLMDHTQALQSGLDASEDEVSAIDPDDLDGTLVPLIRRKLGRDRQQILATMVQMGLQRIVVDEGQLHASMDMRVDTRSAATQDQASRSEAYVDTAASGSFGAGAWGASASLNAGFNQVQSDHIQTREEVATRAGLRSSVDLAFRTEQVPLDRMASARARVRLNANARVPASVAADESILADDRIRSARGMTPSLARRATAPLRSSGKKPDDKKPEVKKPEVKKPDDKKPEVKKPEVKKPEVKKPEVKKPPPTGSGKQ